MATEFKLPDIGEGLAEGEILKWLVSEGDQVEEDQPLVEVMTDKATVEIPSPRDGHILKLCAGEGDVVEIGTTIVVFGEPQGELPEPASEEALEPVEEAEPVEEEEAEPKELLPEPAPVSDAAAVEVTADDLELARQRARAERTAAEVEAKDEGREAEHKPWEMPLLPGQVPTTPAARKLARELDVDLSRVSGSGPGGRVMKGDVRALAEGTSPAAATPAATPAEPASAATSLVSEPAASPAAIEPEVSPASAPPAAPAPAPPAPPVAQAEGERAEERVAIRGLRRTISERMVQSKSTIPHYTYVEEVDMTEVVMLREEAKPIAAERGVKLTYLPFIIRALVLALKRHPYVNASLDEEAGEIVLKRYYNIGIATATDRGLMVPVIKDADRLGVFELAGEIERLAGAARDRSIRLEELRDGTFTITSTGNIGGVLATPIINPPEVAILGITAIRERPVVHGNQIVPRHMLNLSLSFDHRVVDGAVGALFMKDLVKLLEDPKLQLLGSL